MAFWQDSCPSKRTFYKFSHCAVRLSYFYKIYGLNEVVIMPFKKQKPFFLKQVPKIYTRMSGKLLNCLKIS